MAKTLREIIKEKRDLDLVLMVENPNEFQDDFVFEAYEELKKRRVGFKDTEVQKKIAEKELFAQKLEEEKRKQQFISATRPRVLYFVAVSISIAIFFRTVKIIYLKSNIRIGAFDIPFLSDVLNIGLLFILLHLLLKGFYQIRWVFLIGFVFNTIIALYFIIGLHLSWDVLSIYAFHILFKLLAILLLFSKPINQWIRLIKNYSLKEQRK